MSEEDKVVFVKRCPSCGKWMVWGTARPEIKDGWWCYCGHTEPGEVDKSRLEGNMAIHNWMYINDPHNAGREIDPDNPVHPYRNVEIIE